MLPAQTTAKTIAPKTAIPVKKKAAPPPKAEGIK